MSISAPQLCVLRQLAHGPALRTRRPQGPSWVWLLDGRPESGLVDRLLLKQCAAAGDRDTVAITERGRAGA